MANDNTNNDSGFIFAGRDQNGRPVDTTDLTQNLLAQLDGLGKALAGANSSKIEEQARQIREITGGNTNSNTNDNTKVNTRTTPAPVAPTPVASSVVPPFMVNHLESLRNMGISSEDSQAIAAHIAEAQTRTAPTAPVSIAPTALPKVEKTTQTPTTTPTAADGKLTMETVAAPAPVEEKFKLTPEKKKQIRELPSNIKSRIFGQDEVIDEVVSILKTAILGLSANKKKPRGAYMFAGPSGCGKTETVLQVAEFLNIPVKKFSMAEYSEENDVKKLIGSPPGYIGYEDGGQLTNFAKDHPNGIVLFDEIEKADAALGKILLGMLDDGKLTDNKGLEVSFTNTIFFATSNLGAEIEYVDNVSKEDKDDYRTQAIKGHFPPEVINRFDAIIQFFAVSPEVYAKIVSKVMKSLTQDFEKEHGIEFTYDDHIIDFIVKNSYDPAMGGRPAGRFIGKVLISGIVDKMFEDSMDDVNFVKLDLLENGNIAFKNKEGVVLEEMENTKDLLTRYNKTRFTKDEEKIAQDAKELAKSGALPVTATLLAPPDVEVPLIDLPDLGGKINKSPARKTHTVIEGEIAANSGDPAVESIAKARINKRNSPKRG